MDLRKLQIFVNPVLIEGVNMAEAKEKRRYPRVKDNKISLKLKTEQFDTTISQSLNISASGVYFLYYINDYPEQLLFRGKLLGIQFDRS